MKDARRTLVDASSLKDPTADFDLEKELANEA